jgi:hypothetical protein
MDLEIGAMAANATIVHRKSASKKPFLINGDPLMQISWIMQQGKVTALARGPFPEP